MFWEVCKFFICNKHTQIQKIASNITSLVYLAIKNLLICVAISMQPKLEGMKTMCVDIRGTKNSIICLSCGCYLPTLLLYASRHNRCCLCWQVSGICLYTCQMYSGTHLKHYFSCHICIVCATMNFSIYPKSNPDKVNTWYSGCPFLTVIFTPKWSP